MKKLTIQDITNGKIKVQYDHEDDEFTKDFVDAIKKYEKKMSEKMTANIEKILNHYVSSLQS